MIRRHISPPANGPLAWRVLFVLAAAGAAAAQLALPLRLPVSGPVSAAPSVAPLPVAKAERPAALYPAIAAHPLFSPSRRPYVPPPPPPSPATAESSPLHDYLLLGTVVEGNTRIALLRSPGSHATIRAVPGQTIAGWKLREITPDAVEFENGEERFALRFTYPRWPHP